jgi:hypothetical protein
VTTSFSKGLTKAAIYYAIAFFLSWLTYQIWGHAYIHGPGLHHLIAFLALIGGAIWILRGLFRLIFNKHDKENLGTLIVNVVVVASVVTYFLIEINKETVAETITNKHDIITIQQDSGTKSSSIIDGLGDTILLKVGDSTIIDKTKEWAK